MYEYDAFDRKIVEERAEQFRDQVRRRLAGEITENEFKPLRLQNGLYMQLHAYMLRVAVPYGLLSTRQLRMLARISRVYDRGYGHFTTRQNIQYNWPQLEQVPDLLRDLASVEMHAIQTSGNCIRNVSSDPFAGVAADEIEDPRPYCELLRQWSTFHPEFAFLPRKFKFAVTGATTDRAAIAVHDIGIRLARNADGEVGFAFYAGGGQGRTPLLAPCIRPWIRKEHLLSYSEAILRVYNRWGRRDNKFKARIKILVAALTPEKFAARVDEEWEKIKDSGLRLSVDEIDRMKAYFEPPAYETLYNGDATLDAALLVDPAFKVWVDTNVSAHKITGYSIVTLSLKRDELPPGDATADQMDAVAELADEFSFGRLRVTHRQNLVLADVKTTELHALWQRCCALGFASPNVDRTTDIICCPGLDYCNLANARSISVAQDISQRFAGAAKLDAVGELQLNISGCINACGHHHVGHIGVLGINKRGVEYYQLMLGGCSSDEASLGKIVGRAFDHDHIGEAVETTLQVYLEGRSSPEERFLDYYRRVGETPFQEELYEDH